LNGGNESVWVTLKLASSIDGRIATASGESRWITGQAAREQVHRMRAEHDAVVVGANTAIRDDPELSVRLPGYTGKQPARVVLDTHQRLPLTSALIRTAALSPVIVVTALKPSQALIDAGVKVFQVPAQEAGMDIPNVLELLCREGYPRLFVEGGGRVAASFIRAGVVDRLEWFRAPIILGGEGKAAIGELHVEGLGQAMRFRRVECAPVGDDLWERYERPL
jgi:diaminohydroxyphosphoribosylaminopyrimidine deaminase/5-amino-6-(5-phosphoribosylamino)uracil reductase